MELHVDVVLLSGQSARVWGTPDLTVYELRQNAQQQLQARQRSGVMDLSCCGFFYGASRVPWGNQTWQWTVH